MKLRFITPATTAHVHQSTARTVTVARAAGSLSFSAALVRGLGITPNGPGATLTEDEDAPGSWYALFDSPVPAHDCRPLRLKAAHKDRKGSRALTMSNAALAREVLASFQVPANQNRLVLQVLPEAVEFDGLVLWPLRAGSSQPASKVTKEPKADTKADTKETPAAPTVSPVAAGPARPVASIPDASTERLQQRREHLLSLERLRKPEETELAALNKELQKRGALVVAENF